MPVDHPCSRRRFLQSTGGCLAFAAVGLPITTTTGVTVDAERSYPIPAADGVQIDHDVQIILVRLQNRVMAFNLSCPHEHAAVKWVVKDKRFACTKHDSKYQQDGVYVSGRATRNLDRLAIRREGGNVLVDLDRLIQSDRDKAAWTAAEVVV